MKRLLSTTIAALIAAGASGVALADKPVKDQSVTPATSTTATDTTEDDAYIHGQAVNQAAQAQHETGAKPELPPGEAVREVAHTQRDFMQFDEDKNGTLSREELNADTELTTHFGTLDEDGDGILSRAEFNGHLELADEEEDDEE